MIGIAAPNAERVFVLASDGSLQRSDNGGTSYKLLNAGRLPRAIVALDGERVLLIGPTRNRRSTDAGERFSSIAAKPVRSAVLHGAARAGSAVVAYGASRLLVSTNGGASWRVLKRPRKRTIRDASFVSAAVGYVLDARGSVWRTRNGGRNWVELESLGASRAYRLAFTDARNGYVAVASFARQGGGFVLRTGDGGERWRPQLVSFEPLAAVETAGGTAYALAGSSSLYATTSGGDVGAARTLSLSTGRADAAEACTCRSRRAARIGPRRRARRRFDAGGRPLAAATRGDRRVERGLHHALARAQAGGLRGARPRRRRPHGRRYGAARGGREAEAEARLVEHPGARSVDPFRPGPTDASERPDAAAVHQ